jgi:DNA-binding NarL/FixJ family response regulator
MAASRIVLVDDHPLVRDALRKKLHELYPAFQIHEAGTLDALLKLLPTLTDVDLVLLDLKLPDAKGLYGLLQVRKEHPALPVAIVSGEEEPALIRRALDFGASAFIPKRLDIETMHAAIEAVVAGDVWTPPDFDPMTPTDAEARALAARLSTLTPQQLRVLGMVGEGLLNKQIAFKLSVSEATIKAHVSAILQKLNVDSRTQAVIALSKSGIYALASDV